MQHVIKQHGFVLKQPGFVVNTNGFVLKPPGSVLKQPNMPDNSIDFFLLQQYEFYDDTYSNGMAYMNVFNCVL